MELIQLILLPVLLLVQFTVYFLTALMGAVFNLLFRSDKHKLADEDNAEEPLPTKPKNPWTVFGYSLVATLILAVIS